MEAFDTSCMFSNLVVSVKLDEHSSSHDEADTRMLLHAKQISQRNNSNIFIHMLDTVISSYGCTLSHKINVNSFIPNSAQNITNHNCFQFQRIAGVYDVKKMESISKAILELSMVTDFDIVHTFSGEEKIKSLKLMFKNESYINIFVEFGESLDIINASYNILDTFISYLFAMCIL